MYFLGVDIGTTGAKATAFDETMRVCAGAYVEYALFRAEDERYEFDADALFDRVLGCVEEVLRQLPGKAVASICATSFGESFVLLDERGACTQKVLLYQDKRGEAEAKELSERYGAEGFVRRSGLLPNGMYSLPKLLWASRSAPAAVRRARHLLSVASFFLYRLGARPCMDYSLASRTMLFDIHRKLWITDYLESVGLPAQALPEPVPTGSVVGELAPYFRDKWGVEGGAKLIVGGHDQVACALGAGVCASNQAVNTIGTVDCVTFAFRGAELSAKLARSNYVSVPYLNTDLFLSYAFNMSGGSILNWFAKTFHCPEPDKVYQYFDARVALEPGRLLMLPHFSGSGTPELSAEDRGCICGLSVNSSSEQIYQACLEATSFEIKRNLDLLAGLGLRLTRCAAAGGGAKSEVWMRMRAAILGLGMDVLAFREAGTLGTALMSLLALGHYTELDEAIRQSVRHRASYEADRALHQAYAAQYARYLAFVKSMRAFREVN